MKSRPVFSAMNVGVSLSSERSVGVAAYSHQATETKSPRNNSKMPTRKPIPFDRMVMYPTL